MVASTKTRQELFRPTDFLSIEQDNENSQRVILDVHSYEDGHKVAHGMSSHAVNFYKTVHGAKSHQGLVKGPINVEMYKAIREWPEDQVIWQSEYLKQKFEAKIDIGRKLIQRAQIQTTWREGLELPPFDFVDTAKPLRTHQKVAAYLGGTVDVDDGFGLIMEQGTGKTPTAISIMCDRIFRENRADPLNVLIVVPPALKLNWMGELRDFTVCRGLHVILEGTKHKRLMKIFEAMQKARQANCKYLALIISYDTLVNDVNLLRKTPSKWDLVFADESQWFKDPTTSRAKAMMKIRDHSIRRYILTGTPVGNTTADYFSQLEFLKEGASDCASYRDFKAQYNFSVEDGDGIEAILRSKENDALKGIVAGRCFLCSKKQVLSDLPDKIYELNSVDITAQQKTIYNKVLMDVATEIEAGNSSGRSISVSHILTQLLRLAQITTGYYVLDPVYDEFGEEVAAKEEVIFPKNHRLDRLMEIAKALPKNEKMIIWNNWNAMIDVIYERFVAEGLKDQICVYRGQGKYEHPDYHNEQGNGIVEKHEGAFNARRDCRFLLANPASANIGLTLNGYPPNEADSYDTDTTTMVYFSYNWSYLFRAQSEDRAHRIGTRKQLKIIDLVVPGSIDETILGALRKKKEMSENLSDVRDILKGIAGAKI